MLRLTNVYGPREWWLEATMGAPFNYQKVVPTFIVRALKANAAGIRRRARKLRSTCTSPDVARAFYLAGNAPADQVAGQSSPSVRAKAYPSLILPAHGGAD